MEVRTCIKINIMFLQGEVCIKINMMFCQLDEKVQYFSYFVVHCVVILTDFLLCFSVFICHR